MNREVIASSIVYLYMLPHLLMTDRDNVESLNFALRTTSNSEIDNMLVILYFCLTVSL